MLNPVERQLPRGARLGPFLLMHVLGKPGGFGITYLAKDTKGGRFVAIKEYLPADFAERAGAAVQARTEEDRELFDWGLKSFLNEARMLAQFRHPNIVRMLGVFEGNGTAYLVMEFIEGETLGERLRRVRRTNEADTRSILLPLLDGLQAVHKAGVMHRDVKPENILVRRDGTPVLIDFGSARHAVQTQLSTQTLSVHSSGYAPLEQYGPREFQGPFTDLYALSAVAYRMVTGKQPTDARSRRFKDPLTPAAVAAGGSYSAALLKAIDWGLQRVPKDRPQSAEALRKAMGGG